MNGVDCVDQDSGYETGAFATPDVVDSPEPPEFLAVGDAIVRDISCKAKSILSLRSYARAESGEGLFQMFAPVDVTNCDSDALRVPNTKQHVRPAFLVNGGTRAPSPQAPLSTPTTGLAAQWIFMIGPVPPTQDPLSIFGSFMRLVPNRLGRTPALDATVACFLNGYAAYRHQSPEKIREARAANAIAVRHVRLALQDRKAGANPLDLLVAVKLLYSTEVRTIYNSHQLSPYDDLTQGQIILGIESHSYVAHSRGLTSLMIAAQGKNWENDDIGRSVFHSSYFDEVSQLLIDNFRTVRLNKLSSKDRRKHSRLHQLRLRQPSMARNRLSVHPNKQPPPS